MVHYSLFIPFLVTSKSPQRKGLQGFSEVRRFAKVASQLVLGNKMLKSKLIEKLLAKTINYWELNIS